MNNTNCMKNRRLRNQRSYMKLRAMRFCLELTKCTHTEIQICPVCAPAPFPLRLLLWRAGELNNPAACEGKAESSVNSQEPCAGAQRHRASWQSSSHGQQRRQMCDSFLTLEFRMFYKQAVQIDVVIFAMWAWQFSRRSSEISRSSYRELWTISLYKHQNTGYGPQ